MEDLEMQTAERDMIARTQSVNARIEEFNNSYAEDALKDRIRRLEDAGFSTVPTQTSEEEYPHPTQELTEEFLNKARSEEVRRIINEPEQDSTQLLRDYLSDVSPITPQEDVKETFIQEEQPEQEQPAPQEETPQENEFQEEEHQVEEPQEDEFTKDDIQELMKEQEELPVEDNVPSFDEILGDPSKKELILQLADSLITVGETLKKLVD